jgi:2-polyprenyl-6-methoxyphenol hydroxylase-like FAD-dependent oxidoreductase
MAGLFTALALGGAGRSILLLERDPPPPAGDADAVFDGWRRRGATQLRHSHAFLARLRTLITAEHPELLAALQASGVRELGFADGLPDTLKPPYAPAPGDDELAVLVSRRSTLEAVIRAHVEKLSGVELRSGVFVEAIDLARDPDGRARVTGVRLQDGETIGAELIVDAAGRGSPVAGWLAAEGLEPPQTSEPCGILYYTRFYRLLPGQSEPPRGDRSANGDLTFLKFGVFPADGGTFSVTVAAPEIEERLRAAIVRPDLFEAICAQLPGLAPWTDPARSEPVSVVHAMGALESRWREMAPGGRALVRGLFCVGDSLVRTNPLYGRGCSFAAVEAHLLRDCLAASADPDARATAYEKAVRGELHPFYRDMVRQDRDAVRRARRLLAQDRAPTTLRGRVLRDFIENGVTPALRLDADLLRAAMRAFHMLDPPGVWLKRPRNLIKVLGVWMRGRRANAHLRALSPGPSRDQMLPTLGLSLEPSLSEP